MHGTTISVFVIIMLINLNLRLIQVEGSSIISVNSQQGNGSTNIILQKRFLMYLFFPSSESADVKSSKGRSFISSSAGICLSPGMQCISGTSTLLECSDNLTLLSIWDCKDIFPSNQFGNAQALNILCDTNENSCMAFIEIFNETDELIEKNNDLYNSTGENEKLNVESSTTEKFLYLESTKSPIKSTVSSSNVSENDFLNQHNDLDFHSFNNSKMETYLDIKYGTTDINNFQNNVDKLNNFTLYNNILELSDLNTSSNGSYDINEVYINSSVTEKLSLDLINSYTTGESIEMVYNNSDTVIDVNYNEPISESETEEIIVFSEYPPSDYIAQAKPLHSTCHKLGTQCYDNKTLIICDEVFQEPIFEMLCNEMLISDDVKAYGFCDDKSSQCKLTYHNSSFLVNIGIYKPTTNIWQGFSELCEQGGLACADDVTLVACSGDSDISNYAISCNYSNKYFESFCDKKQSACVIALKNNTSTPQNSQSLTAIDALESFQSQMPNENNEDSDKLEEIDVTNLLLKFHCNKIGWQCLNSNTVVFCSRELKLKSFILCDEVQNPYCDTGRCVINNSDELLSKMVCKRPGYFCIDNTTLGECSKNLHLKSVTHCGSSVCNPQSLQCEFITTNIPDFSDSPVISASTYTPKTPVLLPIVANISDVSNTIHILDLETESSSPLQQETIPALLEESFSPNNNVLPLSIETTTCKKHGVQCINKSMLGVCSFNLTLTYTVSCYTLLPFVSTSDFDIYCAVDYDSCAVGFKNTS